MYVPYSQAFIEGNYLFRSPKEVFIKLSRLYFNKEYTLHGDSLPIYRYQIKNFISFVKKIIITLTICGILWDLMYCFLQFHSILAYLNTRPL